MKRRGAHCRLEPVFHLLLLVERLDPSKKDRNDWFLS